MLRLFGPIAQLSLKTRVKKLGVGYGLIFSAYFLIDVIPFKIYFAFDKIIRYKPGKHAWFCLTSFRSHLEILTRLSYFVHVTGNRQVTANVRAQTMNGIAW